MVTNFNSPAASAGAPAATGGSGGKVILTLVVVGLVILGAYHFIIKPNMEAKKKEDDN